MPWPWQRKSDDNRSERRSEQPIESLPGNPTERILQMIDRYGLEAGSHFLMANAVLVLSGVKPYAYIHGVSGRIRDTMIDIGAGLPSTLDLTFFNGGRHIDLGLLNQIALTGSVVRSTLPGLNRITSAAQLPRTVDTDWIRNQISRGGRSISPRARQIMVEGVMLGYPTVAIQDFCDAYLKGEVGKLVLPRDQVLNGVPKSCHGAAPTFACRPESLSDTEVGQYIATAQRVFAQVYGDSDIQRLINSRQFQRLHR